MVKAIFFVVLPSKILDDETAAETAIQQLTRDFEVFEDLDSLAVTWTVVRTFFYRGSFIGSVPRG